MAITLAGITLTDGQADTSGDHDAIWINRIRQPRLVQQSRFTLAGTLVIYQEPMVEGVPITIRAYVTFAKLETIQAHRDLGDTMSLVTPFQSASVKFADDSGIDYAPMNKESHNMHDDDSIDVTLNLITVAS